VRVRIVQLADTPAKGRAIAWLIAPKSVPVELVRVPVRVPTAVSAPVVVFAAILVIFTIPLKTSPAAVVPVITALAVAFWTGLFAADALTGIMRAAVMAKKVATAATLAVSFIRKLGWSGNASP
jgi:hypothetical protein